MAHTPGPWHLEAEHYIAAGPVASPGEIGSGPLFASPSRRAVPHSGRRRASRKCRAAHRRAGPSGVGSVIRADGRIRDRQVGETGRHRRGEHEAPHGQPDPRGDRQGDRGVRVMGVLDQLRESTTNAGDACAVAGVIE